MSKKLLTMLYSFRTYALVALLPFALLGCASTILTPGFRGGKIQPGYQIPIKSGEHQDFYTTDDLSINYHYIRDGDDLKISGVVNFASGTQLNFNVVDYFNLGLLLGNSKGEILSSQGLVSASWVNLTGPNNQLHFSDNIKLPANSMLMAFTYTGQASEGGLSSGGDESGGGNTQFWQYPIVR